jgi:hypothetical protein
LIARLRWNTVKRSLVGQTFVELLCWASEHDPEGGSIAGFDPRIWAAWVEHPAEEICGILEALRKFGRFVGEQLANWVRRQKNRRARRSQDEHRAGGPIARAGTTTRANPTWGFLYRDVIGPLVRSGRRVVVPDMIGFGHATRVTVLSAVSPSCRNIWSGPEDRHCKVHNELTSITCSPARRAIVMRPPYPKDRTLQEGFYPGGWRRQCVESRCGAVAVGRT